jgi:WD40 repeat protein
MKILLTNENILKLIYSQLGLTELQSMLNNTNSYAFCKIILSKLSYSSMFQSMGRMKLKLDGHKAGVNCLALVKEENLLISAGGDKILKIWDITSYQCIKSLQEKESIEAMTILPDSNIAISSMSNIKIRNIKEDFNSIKIIEMKGYKLYGELFTLSKDKLAYFCCSEDEIEVLLLILDMKKEFDCIYKISEDDLCDQNCFALLDNKFAYATRCPITVGRNYKSNVEYFI